MGRAQLPAHNVVREAAATVANKARAWRTPADIAATQKRCNARWYAENKAYAGAKGAAYYKANKAELDARSKGYAAANAGVIREQKRQNRLGKNTELTAKRRAHYAENKVRYVANARKREADKLRATPAWADLAAIEEFYVLREQMTAETGVLHHVDHIIPLRGRSVCGLHVPCNLQVIPAAANLAKGNRLISE